MGIKGFVNGVAISVSLSLLAGCTTPLSTPQAISTAPAGPSAQQGQPQETVRMVFRVPKSFQTQQVQTDALRFLSLTVTGADLPEPLRHRGPALVPVSGDEVVLEIDDVPTAPGQLRVVTVQGYDADQQPLDAFTGKGFYYSQQAGVRTVTVDRRHLLLGLALEALLKNAPEASKNLDLSALQTETEAATGYNPEQQSFIRDPLLFNPDILKDLLLNDGFSSENILEGAESGRHDVSVYLRTPNGCGFEEAVKVEVNAPGATPQVIASNSTGLQTQTWSLPAGQWQMTARRADGSLLQRQTLTVRFDGSSSLSSGSSVQQAWKLNGLAGTITGYTIDTVAGGGIIENTQATNAQLGSPKGLAVDAEGNVLVAANGRIRNIAPDGNISTLAGTFRHTYIQEQQPAFNGDGIPASQAAIGGAETLIFDAQGNLYFSDNSHRVRKITPDGIITTLAGNGTGGFSGDGGSALAAQLNGPTGLVFDAAGNLFIGDRDNRRVRKVTPDGVISTVAGTGEIGNDGNGGPATQARLGRIAKLGFDPQGRLLISDHFYGQIRQLNADGTLSLRVGGRNVASNSDGTPAVDADLSRLSDFKFDAAGNLIFYASCRIFRVGADGLLQTLAGRQTCGKFEEDNGDHQPALGAGLSEIHSLQLLPDGSILFSNETDGRVRKIGPEGQLSTLAGGGVGAGLAATNTYLFFPGGVALDPQGRLLIADTGNNLVRRIETDGTLTTLAGNGFRGFKESSGPALNVRMDAVQDVVSDSAGNIYIADAQNYRVRQVTPAGWLSTLPMDFQYPTGLAMDSQDRLHVAETESRQISRVNTARTQRVLLAGKLNPDNNFSGNGLPSLQAEFGGAWNVYVDAQNNLYIANNSHSTIRKVSGTNSNVSAFAGIPAQPLFAGDGGPATEARLGSPFSMSGDRCGNLFIADYSNHRIRRVDALSGIIETVAGKGTAGLSGDGGDALLAEMVLPKDIVVGSDDSIYFADSSSHRIRKLTPQ